MIDLNRVVTGMEKLIRRVISEEVELLVKRGKDTLTLKAKLEAPRHHGS